MRTILLLVLFSMNVYGQFQPYWAWARNIVQANGGYLPLNISSDPFGNVFVLGASDASASPSLIPDSGAFLARFTRSGQLSWSMKINDLPKTICSAPNGDVYVAGTKHSYSVPSTSNSPTGAFLMKISANGIKIWEKNYKGRYSSIMAMTVSAQGNVYVTGYKTDSLKMDNWQLTDPSPLFIARLDGSGNTKWLKGAEVIPKTDTITSIGSSRFITVDADEKIFVEYSSWSCSNWSCDNHNILKLDKNGNYYFHKKYEGYRGNCQGLFTEPDGDIIMSHYTGVWTSGGGVVVRRYDSLLNVIKWTRQAGGWQCQDLLMDAGLQRDAIGNLYVAGVAGHQCWWPQKDSLKIGYSNIVTDSLGDLIVARIDKTNGQYIDAFHIPARLYDAVMSITMDQPGNCYVAGYFNSYHTKDLSHQNDTLCFGNDCLVGGPGDPQIFLAKLKTSDEDYSDDVSVKEQQKNTISIMPNPSQGIFIIKGEPVSWCVYDLKGQLISSGSGNEIDLSGTAAGIYFLQLKTAQGNSHVKLVKSAGN